MYPFLQLFVGQLPADIFLTLSTHIQRGDFDMFKSHVICTCLGIKNTVTIFVERVLNEAGSQGVWAAFTRQFLVLRASDIQFQALVNALRLACLDLPECQSRGAWKITPEAMCPHSILPTRAQKLVCACP